MTASKTTKSEEIKPKVLKHEEKPDWEKEFDKKFIPIITLTRSGLEPLPGITGNIYTVKDFIRSLLAQQRSELLDLVEKEVIGEDDNDDWGVSGNYKKVETVRNGIREEQRQKLSALRLSIKKKV